AHQLWHRAARLHRDDIAGARVHRAQLNLHAGDDGAARAQGGDRVAAGAAARKQWIGIAERQGRGTAVVDVAIAIIVDVVEAVLLLLRQHLVGAGSQRADAALRPVVTGADVPCRRLAGITGLLGHVGDAGRFAAGANSVSSRAGAGVVGHARRSRGAVAARGLVGGGTAGDRGDDGAGDDGERAVSGDS